MGDDDHDVVKDLPDPDALNTCCLMWLFVLVIAAIGWWAGS